MMTNGIPYPYLFLLNYNIINRRIIAENLLHFLEILFFLKSPRLFFIDEFS